MDDDPLSRPRGPAPEHHLWSLTKDGHHCVATALMTAAGLELRIAIDGELSWSSVYRVALGDDVTAAAAAKRAELLEHGWRRPPAGRDE